MTSLILVTGGTGTLGRLVVPQLRDAGCKVRVLSRRTRDEEDGIEYLTGDLATDKGIEAAVDGAETIVHCAGTAKGDAEKARNLVRATGRAGTRVYGMAELVRGYLRARGKRRLIVPVRMPGRAARAIRAGANLAPGRAVGHRTWEDFLAERVG